MRIKSDTRIENCILHVKESKELVSPTGFSYGILIHNLRKSELEEQKLPNDISF